MIVAAIIVAILSGFHPQPYKWCYAYTNRDSTQEIYVSQHFFEDLVHERWCIKVYDRIEGHNKVHLCVM